MSLFAKTLLGPEVADSPKNLAFVRHLAFNLLSHHPAKLSLNRKRFQAA
jgi:hypothetical protein